MRNIGSKSAGLQEKLLNPFRELLPNSLIENWCRRAGGKWREQIFTPVVALLSCIWKQMDKVSVRTMEDRLASLDTQWNHEHRDGRDFCDARANLPLRVFQHACRHVSEAAQTACPQLWQDLHVAFVDGTTTFAPDTIKNGKAFGYSTNQSGRGHFPIIRVVFLSCAGAMMDVAFGPYAVAEMRLFLVLLLRLPQNMVLVADTSFCSYLAMGIARQRGSHLICPRNGKRKNSLIKALGPGDELHRWKKPKESETLHPHLLRTLPDSMDVRIIHYTVHRKGYRDYSLILCTTLLDPVRYPLRQIVELYLQRWKIELDIRSLKEVHGLSRLTTKSPKTVCRELYSAVLAFNCTRALMAQSGQPIYSLSHLRAKILILDTSLQMSAATVTSLLFMFKSMLKLISQVLLEKQERLPQPRAIKRHKRYPYLVGTREQWRKKYHAIPA